MSVISPPAQPVRPALDLTRDLGGGLVLRRAQPADVAALGELVSRVFTIPPMERYGPLIPYVEDLASGRHPTVTAGDWLLVEDREHGSRIVSCLVLIPQAWELEGVPFGVGRVEIVATEKDYRRRGLVRALFEAVHALSAGYGHPVQAITGIPYFYRQFGYEFAVALGGSRRVGLAAVPDLPPGQTDPYALRPAREGDLPQIARLYDRERAAALVSTAIDERWWRWLLSGQQAGSGDRFDMRMIVDRAGHSVGYVGGLADADEHPFLRVLTLAVEDGVGLRGVMPSVLRLLKARALTLRTVEAEPRPMGELSFHFGREHAVYRAIPEILAREWPPYAWYVRVPDLAGFMRHLAPVWEKRLAASVEAGYTGELRLSFYRDGLRLRFEGGRLVEAASWRDLSDGQDEDAVSAGFPPLVFLQLVFGHRSLDELRYAFPDAYCRDAYRPLLEALFPKRNSWVLPLP